MEPAQVLTAFIVASYCGLTAAVRAEFLGLVAALS